MQAWEYIASTGCGGTAGRRATPAVRRTVRPWPESATIGVCERPWKDGRHKRRGVRSGGRGGRNSEGDGSIGLHSLWSGDQDQSGPRPPRARTRGNREETWRTRRDSRGGCTDQDFYEKLKESVHAEYCIVLIGFHARHFNVFLLV